MLRRCDFKDVESIRRTEPENGVAVYKLYEDQHYNALIGLRTYLLDKE